MREDWVEVELGKIAKIYNGNSINARLKKERYQDLPKGLNYIGTKDVEFDGLINYENGVKIPENEPKFKIAPKGCVLVCSEGGSAGRKTGYVEKDICFGNKLFAITNQHHIFEGKYIFYFTRSLIFFEAFKNQMNGIIGGVSAKKFAEISCILAPLPEQRAIVAKIETLFSSLDSGIADLEKAQEQLKVYRQAVLKKAFEGELTNIIMKVKMLSDECEIIMGQSPPGTSYNQDGDGTPLINGPVEFGKGPLGKTIKSKWTTKPTKLCKKGDLILCVRGSTTGKTNIADFDACVGRGVAAIRYKKNQQYLNSYMLFKRYDIYAKGTGSTFPSVSSKEIREFEFPVCSIEEQKNIVQEIESRLSVCDKVEETIVQSLEKSTALRQSILKKAFEGTLLNDAEIASCKSAADYEPASMLLKRIKAEKKIKK